MVNAPRNLVATVIDENEIDLSWALCDTPARLTRFYRVASSGLTQSSFLEPNATSSAVTVLLSGTTYEFWITAYGSDNSSAESTRVLATTDPAPSVTAPSGLALSTVMYVSNALAYSFTDNSTNEDGFDLELTDQTTGDIFTQSIGAHASTGTVTGRTSLPLEPGRLYRGRVRARSATIGNSDWSDYATGGTSPVSAAGQGTVFAPRNPGAPFNFFGTVDSESQITLNWSSGDIWSAGHRIRVRDAATLHLLQTWDLPLAVRTFSVTGLQAKTAYNFQLSTFSVDIETFVGYRVILTTDGPPPPIPSAPTDAHAVAVSTTAALVTGTNTSIWTELIKVYRTGTSPVVARTLAGTISPLDIQQGFTDAGLNTGDSFKWDLVASNTSGDSDPSDFSNTILIPAPIEGLPDPQSISAAAIGPDAIFVQWEYGTSYYTSANLDWSASDSGPWNNLLTGIAEGVLSYLHNSLDADTEYSYRLTLVDAVASETYAITSATTDPGVAAAPTGPTITRYEAVGSTRARLEWVPTASNVHAYDVYRGSHGGALSVVDADLGPEVRAWDDSGLTPGTAYDYKVRAKATAGNGDSDTVTVTMRQGVGGGGGRGSFQGRREYIQTFTKDTPDLTIFDGLADDMVVEHFVSAAADATNGPFADLQVDGQSIAPRDVNTGLARCKMYVVPAGSALTIAFSGTDSSTKPFVLGTRRV